MRLLNLFIKKYYKFSNRKEKYITKILCKNSTKLRSVLSAIHLKSF